MKKTIIMLVAALLILALPVYATQVTEPDISRENATFVPGLYWKQYSMQNVDGVWQPVIDEDEQYRSEAVEVWCGSERQIVLYYYDGNDFVALKDGVSVDGDLSLEPYNSVSHPGYYILNAGSFEGSALSYAATVEDNETIYTLPVSVTLPDVGIYSSPSATKENFLTEVSINGDESVTVYALPQNAADFTSATTVSSDNHLVTAKMKAGTAGTWYAEITIAPQMSGEAVITFETVVGEYTYRQGTIMKVKNLQPRLEWRRVNSDKNKIPSLSDHAESAWTLSVGDRAQAALCFFDGEKTVQLSENDVTVSDSSVFSFERWEANGQIYEGYYRLYADSIGSATVSYTHNNKTYTVSVNVTLPKLGFYSSREVTKESLLTQYIVKDDEEVTLYVLPYDLHFSSQPEISFSSEFANVTCKPVNYGTENEPVYGAEVKFTLKDNAPDRFMLNVEYTGGGEKNRSADIEIVSRRTNLVYSMAGWSNAGPVENTGNFKQSSFSNTMGSYNICFYMTDENGGYTRIDDGVTIVQGNAGAFSLTKHAAPGIWTLKVSDVGQAAVQYTYNGKTYTLQLNSVLPPFGAYTQSTASASTLLSKSNHLSIINEPVSFYLISAENVGSIDRLMWN